MSFTPKANKNLGQHFLINQGVIARIADEVIRLCPDNQKPLVEIGPGPGALTKELLARGRAVIAVEIDSRMREHLEAEYAVEVANGQLRVWNFDATASAYLDALAGLGQSGLCVCGNLPYNVGTQILFLLLERATWADSFCFMLQKEVVQRLMHQVPGSKSYGVTGIKMAWATEILGHFWVKPGSFAPPPKVDSGVLWYSRKVSGRSAEPLLSPIENFHAYTQARDMVDRAFQLRRKMIKKALPWVPEEYATKRPDELTPAEFLKLRSLIGKTDA